MKYKLLGMLTEESLNIGDYIQALASFQFYPQIDGFIQREELKEYDGDECKVIMNGWYMHHPEHWPPSSKIHPLFVAFHINSSVKDRFLEEDSINYLKKYQPIGCRDIATMEMLKEKGIDAYFSGCMTLTLGEKYKDSRNSGKIYFVDPYVKVERDIKSILRNIKTLICHPFIIKRISTKFYDDKITLKKLIKISSFINVYSRIFELSDIINAEYRVHDTPGLKKKYSTDEQSFEYAKELISEYAQALFVITSRIHCALPCLALGTPVIYTEGQNQGEIHTCRLNGLLQLFNRVTWKNGKLIPSFKLNGKIGKDFFPRNGNKYLNLAKALKAKCEDFFATNMTL